MPGRVPNMEENQPGTPVTWEAFVITIPVHAPGPSVIEMDPAEWQESVSRWLTQLGLTYDELATQARRREFSSVEARKLWIAIGGPEE